MSNFARGPVNWQLDTPAVEGPGRTFADSFSQAYNEQVTGWGVFSVENSLENAELDYQQKVFERTGKRLPLVLLDNPTALGMARHYEGKGELPDSVAKRVAEIDELRKDYPDLPNYSDLWEGVKTTAQGAEKRGGSFQRRGRTPGSRVGGFLGAAVGSVNPDTDPVNFFTLGLGGVGRSALMRIGQEVGIGAIAESVNQFTGVQENRELLGLSYGFNQAVQQIALTGAGAGVIRGGVEGVAKGVRRLSGNRTPTERANALHRESIAQIREQSIYGDTPAARRLFADDFEIRNAQLQEWFPTPRTTEQLLSTTAIPELPTGNVVRGGDDLLLSGDRSALAVNANIERQISELNETVRQSEARIADLEGASSAENIINMVQEFREKARAANKLPKRPVINILKSRGGVRLGSTLAGELRAMGVTQKTAPGLFKKDRGLGDIDNVVLDEEPVLRDNFARQGDTEFADPADVLDAISDEMRGSPIRTFEESDILRDVEGLSGSVQRTLSDLGISENASIRQISKAVTSKGKDDTVAALRARIAGTSDEISLLEGLRGSTVRMSDIAQRREISQNEFIDSKKIDDTIIRTETDEPARVDTMASQIAEDGTVEIAGVRVSKDTLISTDDGDVTIEALFKGFDEDDELLQSALSCKVVA